MDLLRNLYSKSRLKLRPSQPEPTDWTKLPDVHSLDEDNIYQASRKHRKDFVEQGFLRDSSKDKALRLSDFPAFQYETLTDNSRYIRILCLEKPRRVEGYLQPTVSCATLFEVPLDDDFAFVALSYCWGDPKKTRPVIINESLIWATESLGSALEHVQEEDRIIFLWADALCINQEDTTEKSAQVQEMGKIYSLARLVLAWLGPAADESDLALKTMAQIGRVCANMQDHKNVKRRYEFFNNVLSTGEKDSGYTFPAASVVALLNRAWWNRIWVVQEVILGSTVHVLCGRSSTEFFIVGLAYASLFELPLINAQYGNNLASQIQSIVPVLNCQPKLIQATTSALSKTEPLTTRLNLAPNMGATDPRDHIYALLGMTNDVNELGIQINYTKSCSEVYTDITSVLLQRQSNLQILSRCSFPKMQENLPTWVPDWSTPRKPSIWNPKFDLFSAGKCNRKQDLLIQGNMLRVHGAVFSSVKFLGPSWLSFRKEGLNNLSNLVGGCLSEITRFVHINGSAYTTAQVKDDVAWRLGIFDTEFALFGKYGRYNRRAKSDMQSIAASFQEGGPPSAGALDQAKHRYSMATIANLANRQLFSTNTGHIGLGPAGLEVGDLVCVLVDASVPFVIRRVQVGMVNVNQGGQKAQYQLVGESYVQGIMDGEFIVTGAPLEDIVLE